MLIFIQNIQFFHVVSCGCPEKFSYFKDSYYTVLYKIRYYCCNLLTLIL